VSLDFASLRGGVCGGGRACEGVSLRGWGVCGAGFVRVCASWGRRVCAGFSPKKEGIVQNKAACITTNIYSTKNY
jgi:hypothetical protein